MSSRVTAELADLLTDTSRPVRMRIGQVVSVDGTSGRLEVDITGSTALLPRDLDTTFAVDDVVLVLSTGPLSVVVARIG